MIFVSGSKTPSGDETLTTRLAVPYGQPRQLNGGG
jgi:hypothetical protein